jgi:membrane-associated PAP2 superfamily phosphatase
MSDMTVYDFLAGGVALGFGVCALFFLKFWKRTREELFLAFALAFLLLGLGQTVLALANIPTEERGSLYLLRLAAFLLILIAIYRKNSRSSA